MVLFLPGNHYFKTISFFEKKKIFFKDFEINLLGVVQGITKYLPLLQKSEKASIVLFSSVAVGLGLPYHMRLSHLPKEQLKVLHDR